MCKKMFFRELIPPFRRRKYTLLKPYILLWVFLFRFGFGVGFFSNLNMFLWN